MVTRGRVLLALAALAALAGCNGDDDQDQALPSSTSSPPTTEATQAPVDPFCAPADALGEGFADLAPSGRDSSALEEQFAQSREAIAEFEAEAPEEIQADVAVLVEGYEDFLAALEAADYDFTQLSPSALIAIDSPEMQAASENIDAYLAERCGGGA